MKKFLSIAMAFVVLNVNAIDIDLKNNQFQEKYVIGCWTAGFFSSFTAVLNHLLWCSKNNKTPVVYWDESSFYYSSGWGLGNDNVWEYYFEPVSDLMYEEGDELHRSYCEHGDCFIYGIGREKAHAIITKYIKVKKNIMDKVDSFYKEHMEGKKTIGIHLRGTDKIVEENPVSIEIIANEANKYPDCQFLIASDEVRLLNDAQRLIKGKIIYYDSYRSPDSSPLHGYRKPSNAQLGEEVLIEVLLLSRCDQFLHTYSSVSAAALYFNPILEHVLFTTRK